MRYSLQAEKQRWEDMARIAENLDIISYINLLVYAVTLYLGQQMKKLPNYQRRLLQALAYFACALILLLIIHTRDVGLAAILGALIMAAIIFTARI